MITNNLSIVIPTFNRPEKLLNLIRKLLSLKVSIPIIISDNHSNIPVKQLLAENHCLSSNITIIRNKKNLGGGYNVFQCFLLCETDWMWIIGDDDEPEDNSLDIIYSLDNSTNLENIFLVKFNSSAGFFENQNLTITGLNEFYSFNSNLNIFSNILFLSNSIFSIKKVMNVLSDSVHYMNSMLPQFSIVLNCLKRNNELLIIGKEYIVKHGKPNSKDHWSVIDLVSSLSSLVYHHDTPMERKIISSIISSYREKQNFYLFFLRFPFYLENTTSEKWRRVYLDLSRNFSGLKSLYLLLLALTIRYYYPFFKK